MYLPAEDSTFFAQFLEKRFSKLKNKNISYLDMGTGSGILAETAKKSGIKNILAVDLDKESVDYVSKKGFKTLQSNLFSSPFLKNKKFDLITFNAPYLAEHEYDKEIDTTGGKTGDEVPLEFLKHSKHHLKKGGKIFLLISSNTPMEKIKEITPKIAAKKKLFFEQLFILELSD